MLMTGHRSNWNGQQSEARPKFSVIIPAFNAEDFIRDTLDSVGRQSFEDYEVIVVDDGSSDGTASFVEQWIEQHGSVSARLIQQKNLGVGAARNTGMQAARGEYLAFLDADDVWFSNKLERVDWYLRENRATDLMCHDLIRRFTDGNKKVIRCGPFKTYRSLLLNHNCFFTSATTIRRTLLRELGGFSPELSFNGVEDYDCWLRALRYGAQVDFLHESLGIYREEGQGISSNVEEHCEHGLNLLRHHFSKVSEEEISAFERRRRVATLFRGAGRTHMWAGRYSRARRYYLQALCKFPLSLKTWVALTLSLVSR